MVMFPHIQPTLIGAPGMATRTSEWFRWRLFNGATALGLNPDCIAAIMSFESAATYSPTVTNPLSNAFGLIGFMPKLTKPVFGKDWEVIKAMSAEGQLELVLDWFGRFSKLKGTQDCGEYYIAVFMPGVLGFEDSYTLGVKDSSDTVLPNVKLTKGAVYAQNSGFDKEKDGTFTVGDVRNLMRDRVTAWAKNERVAVPEAEPAKPGVMSSASQGKKSSAWIWLAGLGAVGAAIFAARESEAGPRSNPRAPKGLPTDLNLRVLDDVITRGHGVVGDLPATDIPHVRRALKAGYLESTGERGKWRLSPIGVSALEHFRESRRPRQNPSDSVELERYRKAVKSAERALKKLASGDGREGKTLGSKPFWSASKAIGKVYDLERFVEPEDRVDFGGRLSAAEEEGTRKIQEARDREREALRRGPEREERSGFSSATALDQYQKELRLMRGR